MTSIDNAGGDTAVGSGEVADADLVLRTRSGDRDAFGELWHRHYRSGIAVARSVSGLDSDDLVQEAYARIYQSILRGGGPTGSFRAYLFTSIRNTAAAWGRSGRETPMDDLDAVVDPTTSDEAADSALDRGLTHRAFRSLPSRWQEVLWYTEIEQMKPAEIAPLLHMKPTAVAQLACRAREGLREAWIQAHLQSLADGSDCQWTVQRLGAHARAHLSRRDQNKVDAHLGDCTRCTIVAEEAKEVSSRLALVLLPLALGITGSAAYLATLQGGGAPAVALAAGHGVTAGAIVTPSGVSATIAGGSGLGSSAAGGSVAVGSSATVGTSAAVGGSAAVGSSAAVGASAAIGSSMAVGSSAAVGAGALAASAAIGASSAVTTGAVAGGFFASVASVIGTTSIAVLIVGSAATGSITTPDPPSEPWAGVGGSSVVAEAPTDAGTARETIPQTNPETDSLTHLETIPDTDPVTDAETNPETRPGTDAGTSPDTNPATIPDTYLGTDPAASAVSGPILGSAERHDTGTLAPMREGPPAGDPPTPADVGEVGSSHGPGRGSADHGQPDADSASGPWLGSSDGVSEKAEGVAATGHSEYETPNGNGPPHSTPGDAFANDHAANATSDHSSASVTTAGDASALPVATDSTATYRTPSHGTPADSGAAQSTVHGRSG